MTLTEFLLARLAEDEAVARAATPGPWHWEHEDWDDRDLSDFENGCVEGQDWGHHGPDLVSAAKDPEFDCPASVITSTGHDSDQVIVTESDGLHIARHDPARVLRECEAKREIVEWLGHTMEHEIGWDGMDVGVMQLLALPYADHPDYRDEWRP